MGVQGIPQRDSFQRMFGNIILPLQNLMRIQCIILGYAFLNRADLKSLRLPHFNGIGNINVLRVYFPTLSTAYSAENKHLGTIDGLYFFIFFRNFVRYGSWWCSATRYIVLGNKCIILRSTLYYTYKLDFTSSLYWIKFCSFVTTDMVLFLAKLR